MTIKQKIKNFILVIALITGIFAVVTPLSVSAVCANGTVKCNNGCAVDTAIISCDNVDVSKGGTTNNGVWSLLLTVINILTAGVGIAAVGGIVYGSILYTSAGGNADQTKKAIEFIRNVIIGIVAYALMFAFLNFIIPGGLF
ncbi:MAG: hypothetical protein JWN26_139 [Candidatus Saccharibacteria bacterium]|nr:hypothetical protein [Candidatus Saccharibacteria bacterium]